MSAHELLTTRTRADIIINCADTMRLHGVKWSQMRSAEVTWGHFTVGHVGSHEVRWDQLRWMVNWQGQGRIFIVLVVCSFSGLTLMTKLFRLISTTAYFDDGLFRRRLISTTAYFDDCSVHVHSIVPLKHFLVILDS